MSRKIPLIYNYGDTVRVISDRYFGKQGLIEAISPGQTPEDYSYGVDGVAWFEHGDLEFISLATRESIEQAYISNQPEEEDEEDE